MSAESLADRLERLHKESRIILERWVNREPLDDLTEAEEEVIHEYDGLLRESNPQIVAALREVERLRQDKQAAIEAIRILVDALESLRFRAGYMADEMKRYEALVSVERNVRYEIKTAYEAQEKAAAILAERANVQRGVQPHEQ